MPKMFLVAKYPMTLRDKRRPGDFQHNEEVKCVKNLRTRDQSEASVILDVANGVVIKNRFNDNRDFEQLYKYYLEHYADYINSWINAQHA